MGAAMTKGYWVVFADVTDPEGYKGYMAANAKALLKHGGRFLARGGKVEPKEGKPRSRVVVGGVSELQRGVRLLQVARICRRDERTRRSLGLGHGDYRRL